MENMHMALLSFVGNEISMLCTQPISKYILLTLLPRGITVKQEDSGECDVKQNQLLLRLMNDRYVAVINSSSIQEVFQIQEKYGYGTDVLFFHIDIENVYCPFVTQSQEVIEKARLFLENINQ